MSSLCELPWVAVTLWFITHALLKNFLAVRIPDSIHHSCPQLLKVKRSLKFTYLCMKQKNALLTWSFLFRQWNDGKRHSLQMETGRVRIAVLLSEKIHFKSNTVKGKSHDMTVMIKAWNHHEVTTVIYMQPISQHWYTQANINSYEKRLSHRRSQ